MNSDEWVIIAVIVVCFIAGYSIISFIFRKIKSTNSAIPGEKQFDPSGHKNDSSGNETGNKSYSGSKEQQYAAILGLGGIFTIDEVKRAFRELIGKYHPDKVNHLGDEFKKIAEIRTREIMEAYDYFRKKYNIK